LNTYGYVGGNPLKWIDPLGLDANTIHFSINLPGIGGFEGGFVLFNDKTTKGVAGSGIFGTPGSNFDLGVFGTVKKPVGGFKSGKLAVGISNTAGCRSNFDGTDAGVEVGFVFVSGDASGIGDGKSGNEGYGVEIGAAVGGEGYISNTWSGTIGDVARLIAKLRSGSNVPSHGWDPNSNRPPRR
jgi:hypothetical protein